MDAIKNGNQKANNIKTLITLSILILFTGCIPQSKYNYVSYKYATCKSTHDVGIKLQNGIYKCVYRKNNKIVYQKPKKTVKAIKKQIIKEKVISSGCETSITQIYTSRSSGKITTCRGNILEPGQKTRIVHVKGK